MRKALFLAGFAVAGLVSFNASAADELGEPGQIALGAERVFGVNYWSVTTKPDAGDDITLSGTSLGLVTNGAPGTAPYLASRLALDYMVADGVSIGGSIGYVSNTSKIDPVAEGEDGDGPTISGFLFAPRLGYVIPVAEGADFWVRGGVSYFSGSNGDDDSSNGLALTGEGMFVLSPIKGFGFAIGPTLDIGLTGSREVGDAEVDTTAMDIGLNGGVVGWF